MKFNTNKCHEGTHPFKFLFCFNKILIYLQRITLALLGLFLPLAVGWLSRNEDPLSSLSKTELQQIAYYLNMPVDKFIYIFNSFIIAITAIFILLFWKLIIKIEKKKRNNIVSLTIFHLATCLALVSGLVKVLKYLFSYQ